jgi:hypothetical protein
MFTLFNLNPPCITCSENYFSFNSILVQNFSSSVQNMPFVFQHHQSGINASFNTLLSFLQTAYLPDIVKTLLPPFEIKFRKAMYFSTKVEQEKNDFENIYLTSTPSQRNYDNLSINAKAQKTIATVKITEDFLDELSAEITKIADDILNNETSINLFDISGLKNTFNIFSSQIKQETSPVIGTLRSKLPADYTAEHILDILRKEEMPQKLKADASTLVERIESVQKDYRQASSLLMEMESYLASENNRGDTGILDHINNLIDNSTLIFNDISDNLPALSNDLLSFSALLPREKDALKHYVPVVQLAIEKGVDDIYKIQQSFDELDEE